MENILELFFSISSEMLFIVIAKGNVLLSQKAIHNSRLHSEKFIFFLKEELEKTNLSLKDFNKIYFTSYPITGTALRVSLSFLLVLKTLNKKLEVFHIDALFLQSGGENSISILNNGKKKPEFYLRIYIEKELILSKENITREEVNQLIEKYKGIPVFENLEAINFWENLKNLKSKFTPFPFSDDFFSHH